MKYLIYILPLLASCMDLQTQLPDPNVEAVPFVHSVLYTDQALMTAYVFKGMAAYGEERDVNWRDPEPISDAKVFISDGTTEMKLNYSATNGRFETIAIGFVKEGGTYTLRVEAEGKTLTASCSVPYNPVTQLELEPDSIRLDFGWTELIFNARFKDEAPEGHYYQMMGGYGYNTGNRYRLNFDNGFLLLSDKGRDAEWVEATALTYNEYQGGTIYADLTLATLTRDLYLYNQSLSAYNSDFYEEDNPFVEPAILHHNIEGGLGIFGAMNPIKKEFEFN